MYEKLIRLTGVTGSSAGAVYAPVGVNASPQAKSGAHRADEGIFVAQIATVTQLIANEFLYASRC